MGESTENIKKYLGSRLPFWNELDEECRMALVGRSHIYRFRRGSVIYHGSGDFGAILVIDGRICVYTATPEGRELVLMHHFPGDVCLVASAPVMTGSDLPLLVGAEDDSEILKIDSGLYAELCRNCTTAADFTRTILVAHFCAVASNMQSILLHSAERRIASYLKLEYERTGNLAIKTTHEQMARCVGTAREVVSRTLSRLAAAGVLSSERGIIIIKDLNKLYALV